MKNECTIVSYHYVRNKEKDFPKVHTKTIKEFELQIKYLNENYDIIPLQKYISFLNGETSIGKKTCVLTFDDGLKDHYTNVYKILKKLNLPATFFIPVFPLMKNKVLPVQMLQCLLAEVKLKTLLEEYHRKLKTYYYPVEYESYIVDNKTKKDKHYVWDRPEVISLKRNVGKMEHEMKMQVLEPMFLEHIGSHKDFCKKLYLTWDNIKEMSDNGFEIGSHGFVHSSLTSMLTNEIEYELLSSKMFIEENINKKIQAFSVPLGSFNDVVIQKVKERGYNCCLNSDFEINIYGQTNPFRLTRMDTNFIPIG